MQETSLNSVEKDTVVSFHYTVTEVDGELLDSSVGHEPLQVIIGQGQIIQGLENALLGKTIDTPFSIVIKPEDGYGIRQEDALQQVPLTAFEEVDDLEVGMRFHLQTEMGPTPIIVTAIEDGMVTVDPHHPMAGKTLNFDVTIVAIRAANADELNATPRADA